MNYKIILVLTLSSLSYLSFANLSNKAIFYRCYKQIAQTYPDPQSSIVAQVVQGLDPIDACLSILDKAKFNTGNTASSTISNHNDVEAKQVLRTMHNLHFSWFTNKRIANTQDDVLYKTAAIVDYNSPALHYTHALFKPNFDFSNIFKGSYHLESRRTEQNPSGAPTLYSYGYSTPSWLKQHFPYPNSTLVFADKGDLLGTKTFQTKRFPFVQKYSEGVTNPGRFDYHWGGGVLGSHAYVQINIDIPRYFKSNGAVNVQRKWSRELVSDFLCRELPVVRNEDVSYQGTTYVDPSSSISFRQQVACVKCHVTMDQTTALIRNVRVDQHNADKGGETTSLGVHPTTKPAESAWPITPDPDYYARPTNGRFMFRDHDETKIDVALTSVEGLGVTISNLDAPYVCAAKRYYKYFLGIDIPITDIGDPNSVQPNASEIPHRNKIIQLGKSFKQHKSLRILLEEILRTPQFSQLDYSL